jgi:hypothetical protein
MHDGSRRVHAWLGKGGIGETTCPAATALQSVEAACDEASLPRDEPFARSAAAPA